MLLNLTVLNHTFFNYNVNVNICPPAIIFFVFGFSRVLYSVYQNQNLLYATVRFLAVLIWSYVLHWLCKNDYQGVAWAVVLLPIAYMLTLYG